MEELTEQSYPGWGRHKSGAEPQECHFEGRMSTEPTKRIIPVEFLSMLDSPQKFRHQGFFRHPSFPVRLVPDRLFEYYVWKCYQNGKKRIAIEETDSD